MEGCEECGHEYHVVGASFSPIEAGKIQAEHTENDGGHIHSNFCQTTTVEVQLPLVEPEDKIH